MNAYKLQGGVFVEVDDPLGPLPFDDLRRALDDAGYKPQISTELAYGSGAEIAVYERITEAPRYYIDLMGSTHAIAAVVADDFPSFILTLKELHPLLALMGLDQVNSFHISDALEREDAERASQAKTRR
ncbi:hypothetical protein SNE35_18695 [Paucibacter sp. R3-3]|uniref:Uncharacterized protein n=1 Tax=Roseateles agri TaxID=3098619 RepID=A0ABU5DMP2_9BURK|nr:hypothetical protein [Paucibacter sp. R3-3]MDY0746549.1 hypothetical protein [Paucibacter sp. R3-3]